MAREGAVLGSVTWPARPESSALGKGVLFGQI